MPEFPTIRENFGFDRLDLEPEQVEKLLSDCDELVNETLLAFEDYVSQGRTLDSEHWEFLKTHNLMNVYRTRPEKKHALPKSGVLEGRDYFHEDSFINQFRPPDKIPIVISSGRIPGTVEDAALGSLADSPDRCQLRSSYIFPGYHIRNLAKLESPTPEDPFRCATIKWGIRTLPPPLRSRDFVFVDATGMAFDSNGEQVAYFIEICFPLNSKPTTDLVRGEGIVSFVYRKFDEKTVEVFNATIVNPNSDELLEATLTPESCAESLISPHTIVECGYVKKLMWLMLQKASNRQAAPDLEATTHCELCNKSFFDVAEEEDEMGNTGYICQVCARCCCSMCTVSKQIVADNGDEDDGETRYKRRMRPSGCCVSCALEAKNLSAWDVAQATMLAPSDNI